ncbi:MAG: hypothetical protein A3G81_27075 [Betaproteobacteria bacterium RIFCSPLOWO2_12_FULL_65_14]|nr:MAG: hypothetical protein A3G81_27075 [Betaproteobacteria bacterium RIFCSPLOWO2_12_FULL_65_14]
MDLNGAKRKVEALLFPRNVALDAIVILSGGSPIETDEPAEKDSHIQRVKRRETMSYEPLRKFVFLFTMSWAIVTVPFAGPAFAQSMVKLKVGVLKVAGQTNAYVAQQQGFFKKRGLEVELINVRSGGEGVSAMQGGSLDMAITIPSFGIVANERGFGLVMVVQNQSASPTPPDHAAIMVAIDSPIRSLKDLDGKVIGINALHAQEAVSAQHVIGKAGVPRQRLKYVEVSFPSMGDVLRRGDVAAVVPVAPFITGIEQRGIGRVLAWAYHGAVPAQPTGAYWAKRNWVEANAKLIDLYAAAIDEANEYLLSDLGRARVLVAQYTGLPSALVEAMPMINWTTKVDKAKWAALIAMLRAEGELEKDQRPEDFILSLMPVKR